MIMDVEGNIKLVAERRGSLFRIQEASEKSDIVEDKAAGGGGCDTACIIAQLQRGNLETALNDSLVGVRDGETMASFCRVRAAVGVVASAVVKVDTGAHHSRREAAHIKTRRRLCPAGQRYFTPPQAADDARFYALNDSSVLQIEELAAPVVFRAQGGPKHWLSTSIGLLTIVVIDIKSTTDSLVCSPSSRRDFTAAIKNKRAEHIRVIFCKYCRNEHSRPRNELAQ
ncbi:hypothetical protein EVAR_51946_1 [Eumeta japonica]|uniref:Uncharacterized protein n=1 Tax=Eumeta variegata TaxID=151549 RepID=A0A4C1YLT8_EUMVA|nr:hypothetical protein EVAR_51946_1 [Eumeta japonica]